MKNLKFFIALILIGLAFTSPVKALNIEKHETICIYNIDAVTIASVQITADCSTEGINAYSEGLNLYNLASDRHATGFETSRYCQDIQIDKGSLRDTGTIQIQSSYSNLAQSGQRDTSRMYMRRAEASAENLQRNYYQANRNYRYAKGDYQYNYQSAKYLSKAILLDRIVCSNWNYSNHNC